MGKFDDVIPKEQLFETAGIEVPDQTKRVASVLNNKEKDYIIRGFALQSLQSKFFNVETELSDTPHTSDKQPPDVSFGRPVYTNLEFEAGRFLPLDGGSIISYEPIRLDAVLMTVSMTKNIVTTAIQGRNGTIKEYASDGDYMIDVKGVLTGPGQNRYPKNEVELLIRLLTAPTTLKVTSSFLSNFGSMSATAIEGISEVVIESFDFPQSEGFHNVQLFHIRMLSDTPIELTL